MTTAWIGLRRWAALLAAGAALLAPGTAHAATITVTTTVDAVHGTGGCSLRDAIGRASTPSWGAPGCRVHGSGDVTILLVTGTYRLTIVPVVGDDNATGDLDVPAGTVSIVGVGASTTVIDASALGDRILHVHAGATVLLHALTLRGGHALDGVAGSLWPGGTAADGGAVLDDGALTATDAAFSDNHAGNGAAGSSVGITAGGAGGNGGAIAGSGRVVLERVTLDQNSAGAGGTGGSSPEIGPPGGEGGGGGGGGAIASSGSLIVRASTLTANRAGDGGSGGSALFPAVSGAGGTGGTGGAILTTSGGLLVSDTVALNNTGHGGAAGYSGAGLSGGNGADGPAGGLAGAGPNPVTLVATIIASNAGGNCDLIASPASHHDVRWGDLTCPGSFAVFDPQLGALAENGGPTRTMLPATGSLVVDVVPTTICRGSTDQRGVPRPFPVGGPCDVGAVEVTPAPRCTTLVVGTPRGTAVTIDAGCTDLLGDRQATVTAAPRHGRTSTVGGLVRYAPASGFSGSDTLALRLVGANGSSAAIAVTIVVTTRARCVVPQLVGVPLATATARLRTNGCQIGRRSGSNAARSSVVTQGTRAGTVLPRGARVSVKLALA